MVDSLNNSKFSREITVCLSIVFDISLKDNLYVIDMKDKESSKELEKQKYRWSSWSGHSICNHI